MEKTRKLTTIILWVLMSISVVTFIVMMSSIDSESNPSDNARNLITLNINWALVLFAIAAVIALGFALIQMFSDKTKALWAVGILVLFAIILGISYISASSEIPHFFGAEKFVANGTLTESISHWVGTGLYFTYILFAGAFLSIIGFGIASVLKRS